MRETLKELLRSLGDITAPAPTDSDRRNPLLLSVGSRELGDRPPGESGRRPT